MSKQTTQPAPQPAYHAKGILLYSGNCLDMLRHIPTHSIDAVITDPPYACIKRPYGYWTEKAWFALMKPVVCESMRVVKPTGSAVFIVQPNAERCGRMRLWVWDFLIWGARKWNLVQDRYGYSVDALPVGCLRRKQGLARPSLKYAIWLGAPDCYRDQGAILWTPSQTTKLANLADRAVQRRRTGHRVRPGQFNKRAIERGGSTPLNVLPISNAGARSGGTHNHEAATNMVLAEHWVKYICPPKGIVLDMFSGVATVGVAALNLGRQYVGIEREGKYISQSIARLKQVDDRPP